MLTQLLFPFAIPYNYYPVSPQFPSFSPSSEGGNFSSAKDREHPAPRKKVKRFSGKRMRLISWTDFGSVQLLTNGCLILQCKNSEMHFL